MEKSIYTLQQDLLIGLLRQIRIEKNLTQTDLAKKLGQNQSFVSKYESGERRLDLIELKLICNKLGISLIDFVKRFEVETTKHESK